MSARRQKWPPLRGSRRTAYYFAAISTSETKNEEFEAITCGTIDPPSANDDSQVHAVLNQDESIFFKHWRVSQGRSPPTLHSIGAVTAIDEGFRGQRSAAG
jgi:hypothetical protein